MAFEIKVTRRVEFSETDMAGIMHFSNFFRFMEFAEHAFLRSLGFSVVLSKIAPSLCLPRVHASCDYRSPLRFEDEVEIHLLVARKSRSTLGYHFRFSCGTGRARREVAHGVLTVVCAARQSDGSLKAVPLPAVLADKIEVAPVASLGARLKKPSGDVGRSSESRLQPAKRPNHQRAWELPPPHPLKPGLQTRVSKHGLRARLKKPGEDVGRSSESRLQPAKRPNHQRAWELLPPHRLKPGLRTRD